MKAAVLEAFGSPLEVREVEPPELGAGEVVVDMAAASVLAYAREVYGGQRRYLLELPAIPGSSGVGRVRAAGPDATRLAVGDWVFCDSVLRSRDDPLSPDIALQGLTAGGPAALPLQRRHRGGSFAEQMRTPTENLVPIGPIAPEEAPRWCRLGALLVPYGGLLAIGLAAGETLVVNGATGKFGAAAVEVALAMGAACVVAAGRNGEALEAVARRFGRRVRTVRMTGEEAADRDAILRAAPGPIDCVFDILPPAARQEQVRAAVLALRSGGRAALMGGVGMQGGDDLALPYAWLMRNNITLRGQWMYPREAGVRLAAMARAGLVDLGAVEIRPFPLARVNEAVEDAAENAGPFQMTVVLTGPA